MNDLIIHIIFYIFAGITIVAALLAITQNNPVRCVLFLVVAFFASAVLWLLAQAEFLALILILVYVGAVMTLFLFIVMMLDIEIASMRSHFARYLPLGLIFCALLVGLFIIATPTLDSALQTQTSNISNTKALGLVLYTNYVYAFEMAGVILLLAIISAISLAHRNISRSRRQQVVKQIMTNPEDRITMYKDLPPNGGAK